MSNADAIFRWYGLLLAVSVAFAPWVRLLCARLPDRGATIVRPIALLGAIFPLWFLGGLDLLPYSTAGLWVTVAAAGISGWIVIYRLRLIDGGWLRALGVSEILAISAFIVYVWLRGFTPNIDNTEKPMDMALLSASARAESIPPDDPWFSGEPINYYYLGYLAHGSVSRMAGVPTDYGFNLALATTGSMAIVAAAGLGFNLARRWGTRRVAVGAAAGAAFMVVVAGNMYAPVQFMDSPGTTIDADWWDQQNGIGWRSSRIICDGDLVNNQCDTGSGAVETINEFPAFSFLLGDLHPHVMALPFTLMALGLAFNLFLIGDRSEAFDRRKLLPVFGISGALIGSLYAMNSWDYPTFLLVGLLGAAFAVRDWERRNQVLAVCLYLAASVLAWLPFYATFTAPVGQLDDRLPAIIRDIPLLSTALGTLASVRGERTSAGEFLTVFGLTYVAALVLTGTGFFPREQASEESPGGESHGVLRLAWPGLVAVIIVGVILPAPVLILAGVPLVLLAMQIATTQERGLRQIISALFALGFVLVIGAEIFFIQDTFADRMNTVFKVYYQVWTLFAIAAVGTLAVIWREFARASWLKPALLIVTSVALLAGLAYPLIAYRQWANGYADWQTLDGLAYLADTHPDELAAIEWVVDNVGEDDVVLEAAGCSYGNSYRPDVRNNRVSAFSGVPTVIGWGGHEHQWRNGQPEDEEITVRQEDVRAMFEDPHNQLFDRYGVTYLYVGTLERDGDPECRVLEQPYGAITEPGYPGDGWEIAFQSEEVTIYRRFAPMAAAANVSDNEVLSAVR